MTASQINKHVARRWRPDVHHLLFASPNSRYDGDSPRPPSPTVWKTVQSPWMSLLSVVISGVTVVVWLVDYVGMRAIFPFVTAGSSILFGAHVAAVRFND